MCYDNNYFIHLLLQLYLSQVILLIPVIIFTNLFCYSQPWKSSLSGVSSTRTGWLLDISFPIFKTGLRIPNIFSKKLYRTGIIISARSIC